jgi:hypothetical protein
MVDMMDLIDKVIHQIQVDIENNDIDAIVELLYSLPVAKLEGYLPEGEQVYDGQPDEAQEWHDFDPEC